MNKFHPRRFPITRLRNQLLILLALVLGPILFVQLGVYVGWYQSRSSDEVQSNLELARSIASLFSTFVQDIVRQELPLGILLAQIHDGDDKQNEKLLQQNAEEDPIVDSFHWLSPQGVIIASSDPRQIGVKETAHPYFRHLLEGKSWTISDILEDDITAKKIFVVARSIRTANGEFVGAVVATIERDQLPVVFSSAARSEGGAIALFDQRGELIFQQPEYVEAFGVDWPRHDPLLGAALMGKEAKGRIFSPFDQQEYFASRVPIRSTGWVAGASRPVSSTLAPIFRSFIQVFSFTVVAIGISLLFSWLIYRRILQSLNRLQEHAGAIGQGDLAHRVEIPSVQEFEVVAEDLNQMAMNLRAAHQLITNREEEFRALAENSPDLIARFDRQVRHIYVNPAAARAALLPPEAYIGKNLFEIGVPEPYCSQWTHRILHVFETGQPAIEEDSFPTPDGIQYFHTQLVPERSPDGHIDTVLSLARNITERKKREQELDHLNRTHVALNHSSQAMMRATDETSYLENVCRILVEACNYPMVWIGFADASESKAVHPIAYNGFDKDYLDSLNITWADTERGRGPTGTALRTGKPCVCRNMLTDPNFAPWRDQAIKKGYASSIALPLFDAERPFGTLTIYSREPDAFSDNEIALLQELANDLAFGIAMLRMRLANALAQEALQQNEHRLRQAMRLGRSFAFEWRLDTDEVIRAEESGDILGLEGDEVIHDTGQGFFAKIHPDDRPQFIDLLKTLSPQNDTYRTSYRVQRPDQKTVILEETAQAFFDHNGQLTHLIGITADVTEQKNIENKLRNSQQDLNRAQVVAHIGSWRMDIQQNILSWSDENHRIFGIPKGPPLTYETFLSTIHPDDRAMVDQKWQAALQGEPYEVEHRIIADGKVKWVCEMANLEFDGDGLLRGGFGTTQDITARKNAEELLRMRNQELDDARREADNEKRRLEAVMEALPVGVAIVDAQGGLVAHNAAYDHIWAGPRPTPRSVDEYTLFRAWWMDTDRELEPNDWASALVIQQELPVIRQMLEIERFDGTRAFVINSAARICNAEGKVTGCVVAIQDISDLRIAQEALRKTTLRYKLLSDVTARLLASTTPQRIIEDLCREVMEHLDIDCFFNYLADNASGRLHLNSYAGITPEEANTIEWMEYGVSICGCVAQECVKIVAENIQQINDPRTRIIKSFGMQTFACHPLIAQGLVLGTLAFGSREKTAFSDDDLSLMKHIADQVAVALERILAQQNLQHAKNRIDNILESITDAFVSIDHEWRYTYVNETAAHVLERTREELLGQTIWDAFAPALGTTFDIEFHRAVNENRPLHFEAEYPPLRKWFDCHCYPSAEGLSIFFTDSTLRKKQEEALQRAQAELEQRVKERTAELSELNLALTKQITDHQQTLEALWQSQARLDEAQRIAHLGGWDWNIASGQLRWTDEVYRIFGFPPQSFPSCFGRFLELVHPDDRQRVEDSVKNALQNASGYNIEHRIGSPDTRVRVVRTQGEVSVDKNGVPIRMLGTIMDITEQVQSREEAQMRQQQLIQADKMVSLGILVAGVAHEINNPNHSILSNVATLANVWENVQPILDRFHQEFGDYVLGGFDYSESREKFPQMFANALASSKRIELIVNELRDFARYSPKDKMTSVEVNAVVKSAEVLVSNLTKKATERFEILYAEDIPPVNANFQRLEQVVINLIQNACQSLPDRTKGIYVATSYLPESKTVLIEVRDEGRGIPEKDIKHLGDPFFTTKRGLGGMGLGLWISFNIAHEHGGALKFFSKEHEGTRAVLALPVDFREEGARLRLDMR